MLSLDCRILKFIDNGLGEFESLALEVFGYQCNTNPAYRSYCERQEVTPDTLSSWRYIPATPALAFKWMEVASEPLESAERVFLSSGTTQTDRRSRHYMFNLQLYEAAIRRHFKAHLLPDRDRMLTFGLMPPADQVPDSSLSYMLSYILSEFGEPGSDHFVTARDMHDMQLASDRLAARLAAVEEPVLLLGTSFSFVHFFDHCNDNDLRFALPDGSRLMDTGGFKGRSREVNRDGLYQLCEEILGVPSDFCVNEYGMSEMSSQFYDHVAGEPTEGSRSYRPPPWVRTLVINPETMREAKTGEVGLLRHFDLANRGSAMVIQTEDLGRAHNDGFVLVGRAEGAEARGCSIAV
ncbi:MAG: long-chain fatty acid--CoA ligase, partial [Armatimonadetes bacterium]|nr:long-chain fatty acid--CoA ligase [Armatimonadota bacterium]